MKKKKTRKNELDALSTIATVNAPVFPIGR